MTIEPGVLDAFCQTLGEKYRDSVTLETTIDDIPEWDSYSFIEFIFSLEERFGIEFSPDEIGDMIEMRKIDEMNAAKAM